MTESKHRDHVYHASHMTHVVQVQPELLIITMIEVDLFSLHHHGENKGEEERKGKRNRRVGRFPRVESPCVLKPSFYVGATRGRVGSFYLQRYSGLSFSTSRPTKKPYVLVPRRPASFVTSPCLSLAVISQLTMSIASRSAPS